MPKVAGFTNEPARIPMHHERNLKAQDGIINKF